MLQNIPDRLQCKKSKTHKIALTRQKEEPKKGIDDDGGGGGDMNPKQQFESG